MGSCTDRNLLHIGGDRGGYLADRMADQQIKGQATEEGGDVRPDVFHHSELLHTVPT